MPYLDEAARQLGISEKTLRRWLRLVEPPITPTPHKWDRRYQVITDSDVEVIRRARSELPGSLHNIPKRDISSYNSLAVDRLSNASGSERMPRPSTPPQSLTPRPRPQQSRASSDGTLPDGMMSRTDAADRHGIPRSTLRRWCLEGRVTTSSERYGGDHGQFETAQPITQKGLAELYQLASHRADFRRCDDCPHTST